MEMVSSLLIVMLTTSPTCCIAVAMCIHTAILPLFITILAVWLCVSCPVTGSSCPEGAALAAAPSQALAVSARVAGSNTVLRSITCVAKKLAVGGGVRLHARRDILDRL